MAFSQFRLLFTVCLKNLNDYGNAFLALERSVMLPDAIRNPLIYLNFSIFCWRTKRFEMASANLNNFYDLANSTNVRHEVSSLIQHDGILTAQHFILLCVAVQIDCRQIQRVFTGNEEARTSYTWRTNRSCAWRWSRWNDGRTRFERWFGLASDGDAILSRMFNFTVTAEALKIFYLCEHLKNFEEFLICTQHVLFLKYKLIWTLILETFLTSTNKPHGLSGQLFTSHLMDEPIKVLCIQLKQFLFSLLQILHFGLITIAINLIDLLSKFYVKIICNYFAYSNCYSLWEWC